MNERATLRQKVWALKKLLIHAEQGTRDAGSSQNHIFLQDEAFTNILRKHFGYQRILGTALVKDII